MSLSVPSAPRTPATGRWDPFRELDELYEGMNHLWESGVGTERADR